MSIYYQDDNVTLYHGDCLEIDAWLDADVLVTDPPYGSDATNFGYGRRQNNGDGKQREGLQIANDSSAVIRDAVLAKWGNEPPWYLVVLGSQSPLEGGPIAWSGTRSGPV